MSHDAYKRDMRKLQAAYKACKTRSCRRKLHSKRRMLMRRRSFSLRRKAKACRSKKCKTRARAAKKAMRERRRKERRHQRKRLARRLKACTTRACRRRQRKEMRRIRKRMEKRAVHRKKRCQSAACRAKYRARMRHVRRLRKKLRRERREALKQRIKACSGKHCHHLQRRLNRLRRHRFHSANKRIRKNKADLAKCTTKACRVRVQRRIIRERRAVRRQLRKYRQTLRAKEKKYEEEVKACKKDDHSCVRKAHRRLEEAARELRWALERRMSNLRHAYRECKGNKRCQSLLGRKMRRHARQLKHMYHDLEKRVRHRVMSLRKDLALCTSSHCKTEAKRKLAVVFAELRRHLHRRIRFLRRRLSHCQTSKCKRNIGDRLKALEAHQRSKEFHTQHCRSHALLNASFRMCRTAHCRRSVQRQMRHCRRVRRRARRKARCSGKHLLLVKAKLNACSTDRCRARYMTHLAHCHNVVVVEPATNDASNNDGAKVRRLKRQLAAAKEAGRVHHKHLSCIDNLHTKRFLRREHRLKQHLAKCVQHACLARMRRRLASLYRHRRSLLKHRLRRCDHHRHRLYLKKRVRLMDRRLEHYRNIRLRSKIAALRREIVKCGNKAPCVNRLNARIRKISLQLDSVERIYEQLRTRMNRCQGGLAGEACRKHVMSKFRHEIYSKSIALIRHLEQSARDKFSTEISACQRNLAANPQGRDACIRKTAQEYSNRLSHLRMRKLETDLRKAKRECADTADAERCEVLAKQEFAKDKKLAIQDSAAAADALLKASLKR